MVINALVADGWRITHDPLLLKYGKRDMFVDLGAEKPIAAEKNGQRIAVEIKSFLGPSDIYDLEVALGQYALYRAVLTEQDFNRKLYLAITHKAYAKVFEDPLGQLVLREQELNVLVFDEEQESIIQWITAANTTK